MQVSKILRVIYCNRYIIEKLINKLNTANFATLNLQKIAKQQLIFRRAPLYWSNHYYFHHFRFCHNLRSVHPVTCETVCSSVYHFLAISAMQISMLTVTAAALTGALHT